MSERRGKAVITEFGRWLEQERQARNLSRSEFAEAAGFAQSTLANYAQGARNPSDAVAQAIAENLGTDERAARRAAEADRRARMEAETDDAEIRRQEWFTEQHRKENLEEWALRDEFTRKFASSEEVPTGPLLPSYMPIQLLDVSDAPPDSADQPPAGLKYAKDLFGLFGPVTRLLLVYGRGLEPFCHDGEVLLISADDTPSLDRPSLVRENGRYVAGYHSVGPRPESYYRLSPDGKTARLLEGEVECIGTIKGRIVRGVDGTP